MEQKKPKFRLRLNFFDTFVLVLAVLAAAFLLWRMAAGGTGFTSASEEKATVRYTIRFQRWEAGKGEKFIHPGDSISDNIKNYDLGKVVSVKAIPSVSLVANRETHSFVKTELEGFEDVLVTVESDCTVSDEAITLSGSYTIRVSNTGFFRGEGYVGRGPIVAIDIIKEAEK